ncbi:NACHT domain-containing protein [Nonomuraea sp. NPDC050786]|uniref:NACHT domain-containing protein n=1 Tax=Nonomuraea sp. NPDC050786 TaxID=3154840 RepID=UPI0034050C55
MPLTEERRRRWRIVVALAVYVAFVAVIAIVVRIGIDWKKPELNDLLGMLTAVVTLAGAAILLTKWALHRQPPPAAPTDTMITTAKAALAELVQRQWKEEARIRSLGDPQPIPVAWHLTGKHALMDHPQLIAAHELAFSGNAADIRMLAGQFRSLRNRRLIITGGPGTGKTTLAVQLLLELIASRSSDEPVPVMLSIASWDTARHRRLDEWLAEQLATNYPTLRAAEYGGDAAPTTLAEQGHILPILDGLDELPAPSRAQIIRALNDSLIEGDQLILTSRTTEFAAAVQSAGDVVTAAAVIAPAALTPPIAAAYLQTCLPPAPRYDWEATLAALRSGSAPALASVTATPLGLWLVRMVYILPNADPTPLLGRLGQDPKTLRSHLLDHLIDALIRARPPTSDRSDPFRPYQSWDPDQVHTWLSHLAEALTRYHTRDLAWWNIARYTTSPARRRLLPAAIGGTIGLAAIPAAGVIFRQLQGLQFLLAVALLSFSAGIWPWARARRWFDEVPGFTHRWLALFRWPSTQDLRLGLASGLLSVLLLVIMQLASNNVPQWLSAVLSVMQLLCLAGVGLIIFSPWVRQMEQPTPLTASTSAWSAWRADRNLTLARILAAAYTFGGTTFMLTFGLTHLWDGSLSIGLTLGLSGAFLGGLVGGLASGHHHTWLACTITLLTQRRLPRRLIPFLDDMHRLGLLRTVGPLYQFRHSELHDHLAAPASLHIDRSAHDGDGRHDGDGDAGHIR